MRAFKTMFFTEFKLNIRQLDVPIFGIVFPLVVATILGLVYGRDNSEMIAKTFASVSTIGIAANGLMGLPLTLSGYRANKILKQLKVTPIKPSVILLVQFAVKLVLSIISSFLVWLILKLFFKFDMTGSLILYSISYFLVVFAIFGIGMVIASVSPNINTANLLCTLIYFPMLFLSGATIPLEILPNFIVKILQLLPLTQAINLLESLVIGKSVSISITPIIVMISIGLISVIVSVRTFKWE